VNAVLSSLNSFFNFMKWYDFKVKSLKIQTQIFASTDSELTKTEYDRLLQTAKQQGNTRLYLLMQTMCSTGIRISEVRYITVEAVARGIAEINCKGKCRQVFLPKQLCLILRPYIKEHNIKSGAVFVTRNGNPLDRSNIWSDMKKLCKAANVSEKKVFPHNLRHLFARTYYSQQKDIVRLADILGHSSINTTRIYTMETGEIHRRQIQKLGLLRC
jgi:site-specific recombinase XerD